MTQNVAPDEWGASITRGIVRRKKDPCGVAAQPQTSGPNLPLAGGGRSEVPFQSAVFLNTVLPHHCWIVSWPIMPFWGNCSLPHRVPDQHLLIAPIQPDKGGAALT